MNISVFPGVIVAFFDSIEALCFIVNPRNVKRFEILIITSPELPTEQHVAHNTEDEPECHTDQQYVSNRWDGINQSVHYNLGK